MHFYSLTESHLSHISVISSALGTSNLIWYFPWARLMSGVTSQPLRLTLKTASPPLPAASPLLYAVKVTSRHTKNSRLNDFRVKRLGLEIFVFFMRSYISTTVSIVHTEIKLAIFNKHTNFT